MAKVTGGLLSFGARGQIGKTLVMSKWKGIPYARQHVVPANPQTTAQQTNRRIFALLREMFKRSPGAVTDPFNAFAKGKPLTGMNKFVGENTRVLQGETSLANLIISPGAGGGLPPLTFAAVDSVTAHQIDVSMTGPPAPSGWTLTKAVAVAVPNQAPDAIYAGDILTAEDVTAPYAPNITGAITGQEYLVAGYLVWTKPDGSLAYSASVSDMVTVA